MDWLLVCSMFIDILFLRVMDAFNIDIAHNIITFSAPQPNNNSQFGFSVSMLNHSEPTLIVGAPHYDIEGKVFKCSISNESCIEIPHTFSGAKQERSESGFSLFSLNDEFVTCAPKYLYHFHNVKREQVRRPIGKCTVFDGHMKKSYEYVPCSKGDPDRYGDGYSMVGFSTTGLLYDSKPLYFTGAPGAADLTGSIYAMYESGGKKVTLHTESDRLKPNSYMGYASSAGNLTGQFFGDVFGGAPRGSNLFGVVLLYNLRKKDFVMRDTIESRDYQLGSYFGAALCTADLDSDNTEDLLIGSPYYSKRQDEGRVHIYMNKGDRSRFVGLDYQKYTLVGDLERGARFGTTIMNLGDLNNDGFIEIAIGAPGAGAVYIYNCGSKGIPEKYSQVIRASSFSTEPNGFGISISSGFDVDNNTYNDIAIGSFIENKAYIFKTRPVIKLEVKQSTNVSNIPTGQDSANCKGPRGNQYYCFSFDVKLGYFGSYTPETLNASVALNVDSREIRRRVFILHPTASRLTTRKTIKIVLQRDITRTISVVVYSLLDLKIDVKSAIMLTSNITPIYDQNICNDTPCPILDRNAVTENSLPIKYKIECGSVTCKTNLVLKSELVFPSKSNNTKVVFGSAEHFTINTVVKNLGDPAYEAQLSLTHHVDLTVERFEVNGIPRPFENGRQEEEQRKMSFNIANPLKENETMNINLRFATLSVKPTVKKYKFFIEARSNGEEVNPKASKNELGVDTNIETCVNVQGDATPRHVMTKKDPEPPTTVNASSSSIGSPVNYKFYVHNSGKKSIESLLANVVMVVEKNDVKLACVESLTIDGKPCSNETNDGDCKKLLSNPDGWQNKQMKKSTYMEMNCRTADCAEYKCRINHLRSGQGSVLKIRTRILDYSLAKVKKVDFKTDMTITFNDKYKELYVQKKECSMNGEILVTVDAAQTEFKKEFPKVYVIVATVSALSILSAIVIGLKRAGFFKRKRIRDITSPNEEPITENEVCEYDNPDYEE